MKRKHSVRIIVLLGMLGLIVYSKSAAAAAGRALQTCAVSVIPSLFPFFVLTKLLLSGGFSLPVSDRFAQACFGVRKECMSSFFISLLGGYPSGVAALADQYKNGVITKQDAESALCFCNNSGPAFFLSFIGGTVLNDMQQGLILYLIHILSAALCGRLLAGRSSMLQMRRIKSAQVSASKQFPEAISESCASLLQICGLIVFFSVIVSLMEEIGLFQCMAHIPSLPMPEVKALLCGFLELSVGILRSGDSRFAFVLCSFIMGWGGFCVHMQAKAIWQAAGLQPRRYLYAKLLHGLLSAIFAFTCQFPNALSLSVSSAVILLCAVFPTISKKWGRNPVRNTL